MIKSLVMTTDLITNCALLYLPHPRAPHLTNPIQVRRELVSLVTNSQ